jgi:hypothetical protein
MGRHCVLTPRLTVVHTGEFLGMPATENTIEWQEIAIARFADDGLKGRPCAS